MQQKQVFNLNHQQRHKREENQQKNSPAVLVNILHDVLNVLAVSGCCS